MIILSSRVFNSDIVRDKQIIAIISLATEILKPSSRGIPSVLPPRPITIFRKARSFRSIQRFQVIVRGSMLS